MSELTIIHDNEKKNIESNSVDIDIEEIDKRTDGSNSIVDIFDILNNYEKHYKISEKSYNNYTVEGKDSSNNNFSLKILKTDSKNDDNKNSYNSKNNEIKINESKKKDESEERDGSKEITSKDINNNDNNNINNNIIVNTISETNETFLLSDSQNDNSNKITVNSNGENKVEFSIDKNNINAKSENAIWQHSNDINIHTKEISLDNNPSVTYNQIKKNTLKKEEMFKCNSLSHLEKQLDTTSPILPASNISPEDIKPYSTETPSEFLQRLKQYTPEYEIFKYVSKGTPFYLKILNTLMENISFHKVSIDRALRIFLLNYSLPVESQEIDRVIKALADKYYKDNPEIYPSSDYPYILAYSLIMLNTDLHNPKVKSKITVKQFISNVEHSEIKYYIPKEILEIIYDNIKNSEFINLNQSSPTPPTLKKKGSVLQRSLSILQRRSLSSSSSSNFHLDKQEKQIYNISKFENNYDVALDLEYSISSLSNIKIELSSYLYIDTPNLYDLSVITDGFPSKNNSNESLHQLNPIESPSKTYQNSPLSLNSQLYNFYTTEGLNNDDLLNITEENSGNKKSSKNNSRDELDFKIEDTNTNVEYQPKPKKSIDNSDLEQIIIKSRFNELTEKPEKKKKGLLNYTLGRKQQHLFEKGSFLSIIDSKISSSLTAIDDYNQRSLANYVDLKSTQNMLLSTAKINNNRCDNTNNENSLNDTNNCINKEISIKHEEIDSRCNIDCNYIENNLNNSISLNESINKKNIQCQNVQMNSKMNMNKVDKNQNISKLVLQLKEGKMKKGTFCDKTGKNVWNGKLSTYWVVLCEDRLILFSNWKWFLNNNKSDRQKKDQSTIINVPKVSYIIPITNCVCVYSKFEFKERNIFHICFDKKDIIFEVDTKESMIEWMNSINFLSSFITANLNPLKCSKNIKSSDCITNSISNLEKELDLALNISNEDIDDKDTEDDYLFVSSINEKTKDSINEKTNDSINEKINHSINEKTNDSINEKTNDSVNEKVNNSIKDGDNINNNNKKDSESSINDDNERSENYGNNEENIIDNNCKKCENINNEKGILDLKESVIYSPYNINYIEFENDNLLEYYIKDVIEKYEMKNTEYLNVIHENKKLYNQYIVLLPISKTAKQKFSEQLTKIIRQIRKNKIMYERYCCYIYFLKNCFEVDVTSNSNIYREIDSDLNDISELDTLNNNESQENEITRTDNDNNNTTVNNINNCNITDFDNNNNKRIDNNYENEDGSYNNLDSNELNKIEYCKNKENNNIKASTTINSICSNTSTSTTSTNTITKNNAYNSTSPSHNTKEDKNEFNTLKEDFVDKNDNLNISDSSNSTIKKSNMCDEQKKLF